MRQPQTLDERAEAADRVVAAGAGGWAGVVDLDEAGAGKGGLDGEEGEEAGEEGVELLLPGVGTEGQRAVRDRARGGVR